MKKYVIRSIKYFAQLVVLISLCYVLIAVTHIGGEGRSVGEIFSAQFLSSRGYVMLIALALLSAAYPAFGYVRREVKAGLGSDREEIVRAMAVEGFGIESETGSEISFRADNLAKKLIYLWEDRIVISALGDERIVIDGPRRACVHLEYRIRGYVQNR